MNNEIRFFYKKKNTICYFDTIDQILHTKILQTRDNTEKIIKRNRLQVTVCLIKTTLTCQLLPVCGFARLIQTHGHYQKSILSLHTQYDDNRRLPTQFHFFFKENYIEIFSNSKFDQEAFFNRKIIRLFVRQAYLIINDSCVQLRRR